VARVQKLKKIERRARTDFPQNDAVRAMPQRRLQGVADGDGGQPIHFTPGFESDEVCLRKLKLGRIFDQDDAVVFGNKSSEDTSKFFRFNT
jgi:hypothetical protein